LTGLRMPKGYEEYFSELQSKLERLYAVAGEARRKGLDPTLEPEPEITRDIAERVEKLIGPPGISERMRELEGMDRREMAFKIAEEIAYGRFGNDGKEAIADQAVRTALAIITEGVTIAPIQGIPEVRIKQNPDRSQYLSVYFAGPIRPAGGTAQALTLVVADHVRRRLGLERFQPSDAAVGRFIEEVRLYERSVRRFQYHVTDEDLELALKSLPVEATGVSTDPYEVSNFRDVPGIETNRLRGGALIVVVDGVVGRAQKLCGICDKLGLVGWDWLKRMGAKKPKASKKPTAGFMEEIIVGRPVFSFPGTPGGFRLRYGRARNTGLAAVGVHPATMMTLNRFLATGVQLRIELPGKSAAVVPVDSIEPPVVKLRGGSVVRVETEERAMELAGEVEEILFLGDVLVNAGDFIQNNMRLLPAGYDENQWRLDLELAHRRIGGEAASEVSGLPFERLAAFMGEPPAIPTPEEALAVSSLDVPLHPRYTYLWSRVSREALLRLRSNLSAGWPGSGPHALRLDGEDKATLEEILVPHEATGEGVGLPEAGPILGRCLALERRYVDVEGDDPLGIVNSLSGIAVREKAPVFVGARMGRPEKARERKMSPYVHCLFPVGEAGGPQRDILKAPRGGRVRVQLVSRVCPECGAPTRRVLCPECGSQTEQRRRCPRCGLPSQGERCPSCKADTVAYDSVDVDLRAELDEAWRGVGGVLPGRIKCVKRLMNEDRVAEDLGKGLIRARYDLSVFKDGTLRFDATDVPLTHFKPGEVGTPVERLRELGYTHDVRGEPLESPEQMLELKVQDVVLPSEMKKYLVNVSKFLDDLLRDFYGLEPFYKIREPDELVGRLVLGQSPHTSAAIVGRIVGFTDVRNCYAHPFWHAAKRRNCDGDEDAVMLALDPLLNFSRSFLPEQSGGLMDAPLFVIPVLNPSEVDKEAHNVDVIGRYPPEFYRLCGEGAGPDDYAPLVDTLGGRLGTPAQFQGLGYTEECSDINMGSHEGAYTRLRTMVEKLESQLELSEKLRAVDAKTVALKVLNSHFMKDIVGNLRAFTSQGFRCGKCNRKYRRPPLRGVCQRCGGDIMMTVHRGGIEKYLEPALKLVERFRLDDYYADRLRLVKEEISTIFPEEEGEEPEERQFNLTDFMRR